jgi:hypothetical protein
MDAQTEIALLRQRNSKLEGTIQAYDACLNTDAVDRMRKRIRDLETALLETVSTIGPVDKPDALVKIGIERKRACEILRLLLQKVLT